MKHRLIGFFLVVILYPDVFPWLVRSYLPHDYHFAVLFILNSIVFLFVIYFFRYAYKKKNTIIITLCMFLALHLMITSINLIAGGVSH